MILIASLGLFIPKTIIWPLQHHVLTPLSAAVWSDLSSIVNCFHSLQQCDLTWHLEHRELTLLSAVVWPDLCRTVNWPHSLQHHDLTWPLQHSDLACARPVTRKMMEQRCRLMDSRRHATRQNVQTSAVEICMNEWRSVRCAAVLRLWV